MIYVKAAQSMPIPIAIQKIKLKKFTGQVILSNQDSIMSSNQLSSHDKVIIVTRLSTTGSAKKQSNDIQVSSSIININNNPSINLTLK